jgi:hypothetical protein
MVEYLPKTEAADFFQEVKELFAETDKKLQDTERLLKERSLDTDRKFKDTDRKFQDTDRKFKELRQMIGRLGGRLGDFVEEMVRPAAVRLLRERGLNVRQVMRNLTAHDDQGQFVMEIDLMAVNSDTAVAIECKSHGSVEDVKEHLERLDQFKDCFPQYAGYHLYGAIAAMVLPEETARYAYRQGLFVLAQSGETIRMRNDAAFRPRVW